MTVREAAERLTPSRSEMYALIRAGRVAHYRVGLGRGRVTLDEADLEAYRQSCRVEAVPEGRGRAATVPRPPLIPDPWGIG